MQRTWMFIALIGGLFCAPATAVAHEFALPSLRVSTELSATTVDKILTRVAAVTAYSLTQLYAGYQNGTVKIEVNANGYLVSILDSDGGITDQILEDEL